MAEDSFIAKAEVTINASAEKVWDALINPASVEQYMFGATVTSDWKEGSPVIWEGEWKGRTYKDKGQIVQVIPRAKLQYTHYSPLSGKEDKPENYHTVTIELNRVKDQTRVLLLQDNNRTEEARQHSESNWSIMLKNLKNFVEENK